MFSIISVCRITITTVGLLILTGCADIGQSLHNYKQSLQEQQLKDLGFVSRTEAGRAYGFNFRPNERVWNLVDRNKQRDIFAPKGQNFYNYVESITLSIRNAPYQQFPNANRFLKQFEADYRTDCTAVKNRIIANSINQTIFEMRVINCQKNNKSHFLYGKIILKDQRAFIAIYGAEMNTVSSYDIASGVQAVKTMSITRHHGE